MNHQGAENRAILIAGPTASGKSALALDLAERIGGTVINADSMQVYADLHILTARPSSAETARVPHRLFGHVDAGEAYSVGRWLDDMKLALEEAWAAGRRPVVVGGTGLYFKALTQGLSAIPPIPDELRTRLRQEADGQAPEHLHVRLAQRDPVMAARLRPSDPQRILRALEVWEATGRSLAEFQGERAPPLLPVEQVEALALAPDRDALKRNIEGRFDAMMAAGALEEVARLAARNLDPTLPAMRALGVPPLLAHLRGEIDLNAAVSAGKGLTWQYARRQMTFARHQMPEFKSSITPD